MFLRFGCLKSGLAMGLCIAVIFGVSTIRAASPPITKIGDLVRIEIPAEYRGINGTRVFLSGVAPDVGVPVMDISTGDTVATLGNAVMNYNQSTYWRVAPIEDGEVGEISDPAGLANFRLDDGVPPATEPYENQEAPEVSFPGNGLFLPFPYPYGGLPIILPLTLFVSDPDNLNQDLEYSVSMDPSKWDSWSVDDNGVLSATMRPTTGPGDAGLLEVTANDGEYERTSSTPLYLGYRLTGTTKEMFTSDGLEYVLVRVHNIPNERVVQTTSNSSGNYALIVPWFASSIDCNVTMTHPDTDDYLKSQAFSGSTSDLSLSSHLQQEETLQWLLHEINELYHWGSEDFPLSVDLSEFTQEEGTAVTNLLENIYNQTPLDAWDYHDSSYTSDPNAKIRVHKSDFWGLDFTPIPEGEGELDFVDLYVNMADYIPSTQEWTTVGTNSGEEEWATGHGNQDITTPGYGMSINAGYPIQPEEALIIAEKDYTSRYGDVANFTRFVEQGDTALPPEFPLENITTMYQMPEYFIGQMYDDDTTQW